MSDDATPRLSLPYLAAGQAQKHVTLNEALARLDGLVQSAVESRTTDAQPGSPDDGALYIMTAAATGADWAGQAEHTIMRFEAGAWAELTVAEGHLAWVKDDAELLLFDGAAWISPAADITELQNLSLLGVNATADATNKLSVSSPAVLFNHAGASAQLKVNKNAAGDTASHLFQTGFSGRAEFGLAGSDDFTIKVSGDGSAWHDVLSADRSTGKASFALTPLSPTATTVFTSSGTYTVPNWARRLRITAIGGGGGGGGGNSGTNASNRQGGAGGAAGGRSYEEFDVQELAASLTITIGAGGSAGASVLSGAATAGSAAGDTTVSSSGTVVLLAGGGGGGLAGGNGGAGGLGLTPANAGGSAGVSTTGTAGAETTRSDGPGAGGGGGGLNTAGASANGGRGGQGFMIGGAGYRAAFGAAGTAGSAGSAGSAKAWARGCGAGGGGGSSTSSTNAGAGGAGGAPGGGGGGGGASRDTFNSGAGGDGARGEVWIEAIG
jgi:hypothetical protein